MKTNRIHSVIQIPKRCWVCNSKLKYFLYKRYKFNWTIDDANCNKCTKHNNSFYVRIENESKISIRLCQNSDDINEEYIITAFRCLDNKSYCIYLENSIDTIVLNNSTILYEQNKLSLNDFRKINLKDLLKIINSFRKNKLFL